MRVSLDTKTMDIEAREVNYIMQALINNYLFASKNEDPEKIIFPMFQSVPHPRKPGVVIPIEWIAPTDPVAVEIAKDGSNIPEVTPEQEAALDAKDEIAKEASEQVAVIGTAEKDAKQGDGIVIQGTSEAPKEAGVVVLNKQPDRVPKMPPGGDIGPGTHPDGLGSRDNRADARIARDLVEEPAVDEDKEIPADIEKPTDQ